MRTPAGIQSGIAVTSPASAAAAISNVRAERAPVAASKEPARASATTAKVHASNGRDDEQRVGRVAVVDVEHVDQSGEVELRERDRDRARSAERRERGGGDASRIRRFSCLGDSSWRRVWSLRMTGDSRLTRVRLPDSRTPRHSCSPGGALVG
jgi:hypothetical protein